MKSIIAFIIILLNSINLYAQEKAYKDGEFLKFRVHYGLLTAGYATLEVTEKKFKGVPVAHIKGYGATTGMSKLFYKVEDEYQSFIGLEDDKPYRFIRKIDEGGYKKDLTVDFDHNSLTAFVNDKKYNKKKEMYFPAGIQDMVSSFFYLRNNLDTKSIEEGHEEIIDMFMGKEVYKFKLKFMGRETIKTDFGHVPCLVFRPYVETGRVFKEKESLTIWVSDDANKIPLLIKADLVVGSLKASLDEYKGLKHPFEILME